VSPLIRENTQHIRSLSSPSEDAEIRDGVECALRAVGAWGRPGIRDDRIYRSVLLCALCVSAASVSVGTTFGAGAEVQIPRLRFAPLGMTSEDIFILESRRNRCELQDYSALRPLGTTWAKLLQNVSR
jgi:hypothetical protein